MKTWGRNERNRPFVFVILFILTFLYTSLVSADVPHNDNLTVIDGYDEKLQKTLSADGKVYVVQAIDLDYWPVEYGYYTSFQFSDISFPTWVTVSSVTVYCTHYEENKFSTGALEWKVGTGWPGSPTTWATNSSIPVHEKEKNKTTDSWDVSSFVDTPEKVNQMEFVVKNNDAINQRKTFVDYIYVVVEWLEGTQPPPSVSITFPSDSATFHEGADITINADASDSNGTVTKVEFYQGTTWLGEDACSPYSYTWLNVPEGIYGLTAKATDNDGATATSAVVNIIAGDVPHGDNLIVTDGYDERLQKTLSQEGKVYVIQAIDQDYWPVEPGYYTSFQFSDISFPTWVTINSVTVYCTHYEENIFPAGTLEWKVGTGWPDSPTTWATNSSIPVHEKEKNKTTDSWDVSSFVDTPEKVNQMEFVVKNNDAINQRKTFVDYIHVVVDWVEIVPKYPSVSITFPSEGAMFHEGADITIDADASDSDCTVAKVEFYQGGSWLGEDASSPYNFTWNSVPIDSYSLTAKATDNDGLATTSAPVNITVVSDTTPPAAITNCSISPSNSLVLTWNAIITDTLGGEESIDHYEVYRSTDPRFLAETTTLIASPTDTTYTDNTPGITGDPDTNYFYIVKAVDGASNTSDASNKVGEFDFQLITTPGLDNNFIALPMIKPGLNMASDLASKIGVCGLVSKWVDSAQGWVSYIPGLFFTDFPVEPGKPYMVSVTKDTVWTTVAPITNGITYNLVTTPGLDNNAIMLPLEKAHLTMASDLAADIGVCSLVSKWVESAQGWVSYIPGLFFTDFPIEVGHVYMVSITEDIIWP